MPFIPSGPKRRATLQVAAATVFVCSALLAGVLSKPTRDPRER